MPEDQSVLQKKIAFAQSEHVAGAVEVLRACVKQRPLVGETEYATVVNAVTLDAQMSLILSFIASIDEIKQGKLLTTES
jgi:hypothetical protein